MVSTLVSQSNQTSKAETPQLKSKKRTGLSWGVKALYKHDGTISLRMLSDCTLQAKAQTKPKHTLLFFQTSAALFSSSYLGVPAELYKLSITSSQLLKTRRREKIRSDHLPSNQAANLALLQYSGFPHDLTSPTQPINSSHPPLPSCCFPVST